MAYLINIRGSAQLGGQGGLTMIFGDYTCTNLDTATLTIPGGYPIALYWFNNQLGRTVSNTLSAKTSVGNQTTYTITASATILATAPFLWIVASGD